MRESLIYIVIKEIKKIVDTFIASTFHENHEQQYKEY